MSYGRGTGQERLGNNTAPTKCSLHTDKHLQSLQLRSISIHFTDEETEAQGGTLTCPGSQKGVTLHRLAGCLHYEGYTAHGSNSSMHPGACY